MQRGRAAGPLAKMVLYYNTQLAFGLIRPHPKAVKLVADYEGA